MKCRGPSLSPCLPTVSGEAPASPLAIAYQPYLRTNSYPSPGLKTGGCRRFAQCHLCRGSEFGRRPNDTALFEPEEGLPVDQALARRERAGIYFSNAAHRCRIFLRMSAPSPEATPQNPLPEFLLTYVVGTRVTCTGASPADKLTIPRQLPKPAIASWVLQMTNEIGDKRGTASEGVHRLDEHRDGQLKHPQDRLGLISIACGRNRRCLNGNKAFLP
jgi:hypothetical protein